MRYAKYAEELAILGYDVTPLNGKIPILKAFSQHCGSGHRCKRFRHI